MLDCGVGHQGGDTSLRAALDIAPKAATIRLKVMRKLAELDRPLTSEELADRLGIPYESVQPRLSELRRDNLVHDSGIRRTGRHGKPIIAWEARPASPV